ncbi:MAG: glycosyltransferase family 4 protein [Bacteroidales bacterium]|nr:glycosyltransferase family 4 protein [Bacteroidales bacterium]
MKILQVSNKYPFPPKDGGAIAVINLARAITQAGCEVSLLAMKTPKHNGKGSAAEDGSFYHKINHVFVDTTIRPFPLLANLLFSSLPYNAVRFIDRRFSDVLAGILKNKSYDIVQLEGLYLMPYADVIRRVSKAKIVLRSHNIEHEIWKRIAQKTGNLLLKPYYTILAKRMAAFEASFVDTYDMLVPISLRDDDFYTQLGNTKPSMVIPFGIDTTLKPSETVVHKQNSLFFIGSLDYIPNHEGLVWFIEKVWKKFLHPLNIYSFYIAGRNAPAGLIKYLKKQAVSFVGEVDDACSFMKSGGVMVVPVLSGGGIRVRIIEAMAMGIPVVSTAIGAEGLDVSDGSNIMINDDPQSFAHAVVKLLENQTFFTNIGKNARHYIEEKMDANRLAGELLTFYRNNI